MSQFFTYSKNVKSFTLRIHWVRLVVKKKHNNIEINLTVYWSIDLLTADSIKTSQIVLRESNRKILVLYTLAKIKVNFRDF